MSLLPLEQELSYHPKGKTVQDIYTQSKDSSQPPRHPVLSGPAIQAHALSGLVARLHQHGVCADGVARTTMVHRWRTVDQGCQRL